MVLRYHGPMDGDFEEKGAYNCCTNCRRKEVSTNNSKKSILLTMKAFGISVVLSLTFLALQNSAHAQDVDPLASNNGIYPSPNEWSGPFRISNLDYSQASISNHWTPGAGRGALTTENAESYVVDLKEHLAESLKEMINTPLQWNPKENGWYDMVWSGHGSPGPGNTTDPNSGRESLLSSYTGQILPMNTFAENAPTVNVQNHAVIYYNATAAVMLGRLWENLYDPDISDVDFPQGSIIVKAEAATPTPEQWPVLAHASIWNVYRPSVETQENAKSGEPLKPEVLDLRALQMSIAVKDTIASPETGWVFLGYVYDTNAAGDTPWDRFVPLGAQWGNDPEFADNETGRDPAGGPLKETWVNPKAPEFVQDTLGWGERLAGPMDVATRHNVLTPSGKRYQGNVHLRASSCISCHGSAEFPFTTNLYPSPNKSFPPDGMPFLLYDPGSPEWAQWFQNRPGNEAMSSEGRVGITALDYDMVIMFALSAFNAAMGNDIYVQSRFDVH